MKEAKKYINHHRVQLSGKWYVPYERVVDAIEIAAEETRLTFQKEKQADSFKADPDVLQ